MTIDHDAFLRILQQYGLSLGQYYILIACSYGPKPDWGQLGDAIEEATMNACGPITDSEAEEGMVRCFADGWIRVVDEAGLAEIHSLLERQGGLGPLHDLPGIGDVDFTVAGAEKFRALHRDLHGVYPAWDEVIEVETASGRSLYCPTLDLAQAAAANFKRDRNTISVSEPVTVGPWFNSWWERLPGGHRVDVIVDPRVLQAERSSM